MCCEHEFTYVSQGGLITIECKKCGYVKDCIVPNKKKFEPTFVEGVKKLTEWIKA